MRCTICNTLLTQYETSRRYNSGHELEGTFVDLCGSCLVSITECEPTITTDFSVDVVSYSSDELKEED